MTLSCTITFPILAMSWRLSCPWTSSQVSEACRGRGHDEPCNFVHKPRARGTALELHFDTCIWVKFFKLATQHWYWGPVHLSRCSAKVCMQCAAWAPGGHICRSVCCNNLLSLVITVLLLKYLPRGVRPAIMGQARLAGSVNNRAASGSPCPAIQCSLWRQTPQRMQNVEIEGINLTSISFCHTASV